MASQQLSEENARNYTSIINILGILGFIPALVGFFVWRDQSDFLKRNIMSALNFQITMLIVSVIGSILSAIVIGIFIMIAAGVVVLVFSILAFVTTREGNDYNYPLTIRFIK